MTRASHPYADPECRVCEGTGEMQAKYPVDGELVYVDCWCTDEPNFPDPDEHDADPIPLAERFSW